MKKLLFISILSLCLLSCSSDDKDEDVFYIVYVDKRGVACIDEIAEKDLFYYNSGTLITSLNQAKKIVEQANKEALENYESGKISCFYKYTYIKIEDDTALPRP